jgi:hypothetical protein
MFMADRFTRLDLLLLQLATASTIGQMLHGRHIVNVPNSDDPT